MRAVVTGCAGFIGSTLSETLLAEGWKVTGVDMFTDYYDRKIKRRNMKSFKDHKRFTLVRGNLNNIDIKKIFKKTDYIFHLAAQAGVRYSWGNDFKIYLDQNIRSTQRILEIAKGMKNIKKIMFASSSSVYGRAKKTPMKESHACFPHSPYGVTKLAAENLMSLYHANYNVPTVSLRYFTVYGPRQRPDMAFHRFIRAGLNGRPITIYGNGKQSRDFTYVGDIVRATIRAGLYGKKGGIYNIGGGSRIILKDAIKILSQKLSPYCELKTQYVSRQKGDVEITSADISLAQKDIGYKPTTRLDAGLGAEIEWYNQMRKERVLS